MFFIGLIVGIILGIAIMAILQINKDEKTSKRFDNYEK